MVFPNTRRLKAGPSFLQERSARKEDVGRLIISVSRLVSGDSLSLLLVIFILGRSSAVPGPESSDLPLA
jgi:hypothetical protein